MAITLTRPTTGTKVTVDGPDVNEYAGWYVIQIKLYRCSCGRIVEFAEADTQHIIVVWEEKDDEHILHAASAYKINGMNPTITEYKPSMGKCIEFSVAVMQGMIK